MTRFGRTSVLSCVAVAVCLVAFGVVGVTPVFAAGWWHISSETVPTNLAPGGTGQVLVVFSNLGDQPVSGESEPVLFKDKLPAGLVATHISGPLKNKTQVVCSSVSGLECSYTGVLYPYEEIEISISVEVKTSGEGTLSDEASVQGGGAPSVSRGLKVPVSSHPAGFGIANYEVEPLNGDGSPAVQAGAHPFQITTTLGLDESSERYPVALPKDLSFMMPPGVVGNPTAVGQCTMANFFALVEETDLCPPGSVIGVATVIAHEPLANVIAQTVPVFNLVPSQGEPARFGFEVIGKIPVVIDTSVRSGKDYGVNVTVSGATQTAGLLWSQVTLWGVPGAQAHNNARGWECVAGRSFEGQIKKPCPAHPEEPEEPFLIMPSACASNPKAEPVMFGGETDSWADPGVFVGAEYEWLNQKEEPLGFQGCGALPFEPSIEVSAEQHSSSTPTGVQVTVSVPQETTLQANEPAEADVRDTTVTLPEGVQLSPSAANGLQACSEQQIGYTGINPTTQTEEFTPGKAECPDASKVGTVRIKTPLLANELTGSVYLASPAPSEEHGRNPFNSLVALYIVAEDPVSGVRVKLVGEGHVNEQTLQISTTFKNAPQVPFEELVLDMFGGPRASLSTPEVCGSYPTSALFTSWAAPEAPFGTVSRPEGFIINSGVGGSACPAGALPFAPGFTAYTQNTQAGSFTGFTMELTRPDGDQALSTVSMHLPSGIAALLSSVQLCTQAQALEDACPAGSEVGQAIAFAGLGSEPYIQEGGRVYITERYENAPFGLVIVTPASAGPFNLGYVTVRSKLYVNPNDASVTIVSDPLPTEIRGIPLQLKRVIVNVDRPGFEFNPTSCEPLSITGTIAGAEGASSNVTSPFKAENCDALPFGPELVASAVGHGSKAEGTTFKVVVRSGGTNNAGVAQAGIAKVQLQLPKQLSSRLPTLQKACTDTVFNQNPAACDEGSVIGYATIHTPVLSNPLTGPAYLVSHGGAAFPDVEFLLQGEGIELILDGKTDIKGEITYSKFESTPDAPFTTFETVLPAGPHGVLTPNVAESKRFSLCGETLTMPTTMIAQNGMRIERETKVAVTGCGEVRSAKAHKLTLVQRLERALGSCRHKHSKRERARCEQQARGHYTRLALAACRQRHRRAAKKRRTCEKAARKRLAAKNARHTGRSRNTKG